MAICDFLINFPALWILAKRTTKGIKLDYLGDRKQIEQDIQHEFYLTDRVRGEYRCMYCDTKAE